MIAAKTVQKTRKQDMVQQITNKISDQWKTIQKAFNDLNRSKTGKITQDEFKFYLNHWGITTTPQEFEEIWSKYDLDKDGFISYADFQATLGMELFPQEGLYFRQDKETAVRIESCQHPECV